MVEIPTAHQWVRRLVVLVAGVLILMLVSWVLDDPRTNLETDWTAFDRAADRFLAGEETYRPFDADAEPLPYLYPPFVLPLSLPLAAFGFYGSFAFSAIVTLVAFGAGMALFARSEHRSFDATTGLIVATASGAVVSATLIGQYSGLYVLFFGLAAWLWSQNRMLLAGVVLALLWMKPNVAAAVPFALAWSRSWKSLSGFLLGTVGLLTASLALGLDRWRGFFANAEMMAELQRDDIVPFEKMVSILGGAQSTLGFGSQSAAAIAIFLGAALILGVSVLVLWSPTALSESPIRAFGALAVFIVAANPRIYFYDATLIAMGMFGLWASARTVGGNLARRWLPIASILTWIFLWGGLFVGLNRMVGIIAAVGLVASALDHVRERRTSKNSGLGKSEVTGSEEQMAAFDGPPGSTPSPGSTPLAA